MNNPIVRVFIIAGFSIAITTYLIIKIDKELQTIAEALNDNTIATEAIYKKVDADDRERKKILKLRKNLEVWKDTQCIECHNTITMALPIRKINIPEAMKIVRQGNQRTLETGMPQFSKQPKKNGYWISDSDLEIKLQLLYIKELLE